MSNARLSAESLPEARALLWMKNVHKSFPGVQALDNVSLHVQAGEVLGLIGQNGAGKIDPDEDPVGRLQRGSG